MDNLLKTICDNLTDRYAVTGGDSQTVFVTDKETGEYFEVKVIAQ